MLKFVLVTPEGKKVEKKVYEAILPASEGEIAVLPGHKPLVATLRTGVISLRLTKTAPDSQLEHLALSGGFVRIGADKVLVMADTAQRAEDIDELKVEEAIKLAKEKKEKARDDAEIAQASAVLERSLAQLKAAQLKKRRHRGG